MDSSSQVVPLEDKYGLWFHPGKISRSSHSCDHMLGLVMVQSLSEGRLAISRRKRDRREGLGSDLSS